MECYKNVNQRQTEIDCYKKENNEILVCMLIGGILYIIYILLRKFIFSDFFEIDSQSITDGKMMIYVLLNGIVGIFFFVFPFGWNVLRKRLNKDSVIAFGAAIILRILLSGIVGIAAFPYYLVRLIINTMKIKRIQMIG